MSMWLDEQMTEHPEVILGIISIIVIIIILWCMPVMLDDPHPETLVFIHEDTHVFCC